MHLHQDEDSLQKWTKDFDTLYYKKFNCELFDLSNDPDHQIDTNLDSKQNRKDINFQLELDWFF